VARKTKKRARRKTGGIRKARGPRGAFIVIEGPDGGGKTTHARELARALRAEGREVLLTREPGGTPLGERLRRLLLSVRRGERKNEERTTLAELFLFMAARAELVETVIRPALDEGKIVVSDRFLPSSVVYQGVAGGLGAETVEEVGRLATGGLEPELTVILDLPAATGLARSRRGRGGADRIESRGAQYHEKVRRGFLRLARRCGSSGVLVVDTRRPEAEVRAAILARVRDVLGGAGGGKRRGKKR